LIAFDIDSVLAQIIPAFTQALQIQFNETYTINDFHHYSFEECNFRPEVEMFLSMIVNDPAFYVDLEPIEYSQEVTHLLAQEGLIYLSSRPNHLEEVTKLWLEKHNFPQGKLILTRQKCAMMAIHNCRFIVEDAGHHALDIANANYPVYLLDYPWNQDIKHFFIKRIKSLREIIELPEGSSLSRLTELSQDEWL
jgi:uncharacterized HAD superfamily protein